MHLLHRRVAAFDQLLHKFPHAPGLTAVARGDQRHLPGRHRHQLAVEKIGLHGVRQRHAAAGHADGGELLARVQFFVTVAQVGQHLAGGDEGLVVVEKHILVADGDDVVVKHAGVDRPGRLLREDRVVPAQLMQPRHGLERLQRLPGGEAARAGFHLRRPERAVAVDEKMQAVVSVRRGEARVVGRPLVAEALAAPHRLVHNEARLVPENGPQRACGLRRFDGAVEFRRQVGRGEVRPAVGRVARGGDGRRIGHPHVRGRGAGHQQLGRGLGRRSQHLRIGAAKTQRAQRLDGRSLVRGQHGLGHAEVGQKLHLGQALQRGFTRIRRFAAVRHRRHVAMREAGVVVRRADQPVEINLAGFHGKWRPGGSCAGSCRAGTSMEATGYEQ